MKMPENSQCRDFLEQFHSLTGITIKERQQNLYQLFRQYKTHFLEEPTDLDMISINLTPSNYLEMVFRIDFFIYFRRFQELYKEFCNGDRMIIKKLSRHQWFFQKAFGHFTAEQLINEVFPTVSHVVKLKILRKLPLNEEQSDEIFDRVYNRYGLHLATIIIPKCSANKIKQILNNHFVKLNSRHLKIICKKDPNLIMLYLEQKSKHEGGIEFSPFEFSNRDYTSIIKYVAQTNPEMFTKLVDKYELEIFLGSRTSKKIINSYKDMILAKFDKYAIMLNYRSLVKILGLELKPFFFKSNKYGNEYWHYLLKYYPKNKQYYVFKTAYNEHFHHNFGEDVNEISDKILNLIPDVSEREKLAMAIFEKKHDKRHLKYFKPETSFEIFLEKVDHLQNYEIVSYIKIIIDCCNLNKDTHILFKFLELIKEKFKNYHNLCHEFCNKLSFHNPEILDEFNEEQWHLLLDAMDNMDSKVTEEARYQIEFKYIEFLIRNNKPLKESLLKYQKWFLIYVYNLFELDRKMIKRVLTELVEIDDENPIRNDYYELLEVCLAYNRENPKNSFDILKIPGLLNVIKNTLESGDFDDYKVIDCMPFVVCQRGSQENFEEIKHLFFQNLETFGKFSIYEWFLRYEPHILAANFDRVIDDFVSRRAETLKKGFWYQIKKYNHLELDKKVIKFCISKLTQDDFKEKKIVSKILSVVAPSESYLEFFKSHLGTSVEDDLTEDENVVSYPIQCHLIRSLHNINAPSVVLPIALEFCKNNYPRAALPSIYSSFYRLPENDTKSFIEQIKEHKVLSFKKHSVNLSCVLYDTDTVYSLIKNTKLSVLMPFYKYFAKNPSEKLWELLEIKLVNIDLKLFQIFKKLLKISVPFEYKTKCIKIMWKLISQCESNKMKKILIEKTDVNIMKNLEPKFLYEIMEENIFRLKEVDSFIANLFIHIDDNEKFDFLERILRHFKENSWRINERESRQKLHDFILAFYDTYMKSEYKSDDSVANFLAKFERIFTFEETFEESLLIKFMKLKEENVEEISKFIIELNNQLVNNYGPSIVNLFSDVVKNFLVPYLFKTDQQKFEFYHSLLNFVQSFDDDFLMIKQLPNEKPKEIECASLYDDILNKLKVVDDDGIQLHLNMYLKVQPPSFKGCCRRRRRCYVTCDD